MASPRANSESQDGSVETRFPRSRVPRQATSEIPEGSMGLRSERFRVFRFTSDADNNQQPGNHADGNSMTNIGMKRSVSSTDLRRPLSSSHPQLQRTVSSMGALKAEILRNNVGPKNRNNMVLQLVLPSNNQMENGNYLTQTSIDEVFDSGETNIRRRSIGSQQEGLSNAGTECFVNQGYTNDLDEYARSFVHSPMSTVSSIDKGKSTSPEDKKKMFRKHLTKILSSMYALFIVTLGVVVYVTDTFLIESSLAEGFSLYLIIVAFTFILYVTVDVRLYVHKRNRYNDLAQKNIAQDIEMKESPSGDYHLNITLPEYIKIQKELQHHYCFSKDRHSGNFYLKIGAGVFCLGHLIHSGLLLGYQILFLTSDGEGFYECATVESLVLDILYPLYSFLLLHFLFKYSNIVINRGMSVARFGLMHCISSSLCFWIWTILRETVEALSHHADEHEDETEAPTTISEGGYFAGQPVALPLSSYNKRGAALLKAYLNTSVRQFAGQCGSDAGMSTIYRNYSPYLYPFTVEFSILVVGVLFVIWESIGKCKEKEEMSSTLQCDTPEGSSGNLESNIVIHADCHSANKGLFGGIVVMVLTVVSVILFIIAVNDARYEIEAVIINTTTGMIITILMLITCIFAYRQLTRLDVSNHHASFLDDLFLFMCVPAFFLNGIVVLIPAIESGRGTAIALPILEIIQILVQTPMIIDGLRRSSNTKELRREKPGRELLTFLIVCNIALWVMQTFEVKSHDLQGGSLFFYGEELWTIIGHLCVPLMMFYRFHSSVGSPCCFGCMVGCVPLERATHRRPWFSKRKEGTGRLATNKEKGTRLRGSEGGEGG